MITYKGITLRKLAIADQGVILNFDDVELICREQHTDRLRAKTRRCWSALRDNRKLDIVADDDRLVISVERSR
jgi:hypothetical protein